jgi:hypothetical protein
MKSFNEWLKERSNLEENIADYTPGFVRRPLQKMGWMGSSTAERKKRAEDRARMEKELQAKNTSGTEEVRKKQAEWEEKMRRNKIQQASDQEMAFRSRNRDTKRRLGK